MTRDEGLARLRALGLPEEDAQTLYAHFDGAERHGKPGHGHSRIEWLGTAGLDVAARPRLLVDEEAYEHWDGAGGLGYLVLAAVVRRLAERPPERVRLVVCSHTFPTGALGLWARQVAEGGLARRADGHVAAAPPPSDGRASR